MGDNRKGPTRQGGAKPKLQVSDKDQIHNNPELSANQYDTAKTKPVASALEPWPEPVDLRHLLDELRDLFAELLSLPKWGAEILALWVLCTYVLDAAEVFPRLVFTSPVPECGKTTALKLLAEIVCRPLFASNMTLAVMFRLIELMRPTLLLDEADTFLDGNPDFLGLLNSGHEHSGAYWRCDGDSHEPRRFPTWAAMAIAKIGDLRPAALRSRSIEIRMHRATPVENPRRLSREDKERLHVASRKAQRWQDEIIEHLKQTDPDMPKELRGRAADNWRLMLAVADMAGGIWSINARKAAIALSVDSIQPSRGERLLIALRQVLDAHLDMDRLPSVWLCKAVGEVDDDFASLGQRGLARLLEPFGIRPRVIRIGRETPRGYRRSDFKDAFARYLPRNPQHRNK